MTYSERLRRRADRVSSHPAAELLEQRVLPTVTLQIDYSLDNGFFAAADRRAAIEQVAGEIGSRLNDSLAAIPSGSYTVTDPKTFTNTTVTFSSAANSLRVFVGGSALGGSTVGQGGWRTNTGIRNFNSGADFAPYVGYIGFDADGTTAWDFTGTGSGTDFKSVARHEMLHVLGIGGAQTWDALVSGGVFTGANARAANGGVNPAVTPDGGHFAQTVNSIMRPVVSEITHPTAIDWGALDDIGWDVTTAAPPGTYADVIARTSGGAWMISQNAAVAGGGTLLSPTAFGQWAESAGWNDVHTGDFNGDGRTDVAGRTDGGQWYVGLNTGSGFTNQHFGLWNKLAGWRDVVFGDFNDDGRTDVAGRTAAGEWYVSRSTGTAFATAPWAAWNERAQWQDVRVGDFTGDGRADLLGRTSAGEWYVARSTGTAFATSLWGRWNGLAVWHDLLVADFDGNGKADVAGRTDGGEWYVGLTVGNATTGMWFSTARWAAWSGTVDWRGVAAGDFGGDARPDIIARTPGGQWFLAVNIGGSVFSTIPYGVWAEISWQTILYADFAGTSKADVLARASNGGWVLGENTGSALAFRSYGQWDASLGWQDAAASRRFLTAGAGAAALAIAADGSGGQLQAAPSGATTRTSPEAPAPAAFAPTPPAKTREAVSTPAEDAPRDEADRFASLPLTPATGRTPADPADSLFADALLLDALAAAA